MKRATLHPDAEQEFRTSESFYEERGGHDLALDFIARVEAALRIVVADPQRFPRVRRYRKVQKARLTRFPFCIYYIERAEDIWVVAIAHDKRRPEYWAGRLD